MVTGILKYIHTFTAMFDVIGATEFQNINIGVDGFNDIKETIAYIDLRNDCQIVIEMHGYTIIFTKVT